MVSSRTFDQSIEPNRASFCPIIIGNKHAFDFSHNEPDEKYDTALRILAVNGHL